MKTTLHTYAFLTSNPAELAKYRELHDRLASEPGRHFFNVNAGNGPTCGFPLEPFESAEVELETNFVFDNQWNTAPSDRFPKGYRVFDWYEGIWYNNGARTSYKAGHYLEITPEMIQLRADIHKCGFCGAQYNRPEIAFCVKCLDSEYLKEKELFLLRLRPAGVHDYSFPPLTAEELAEILPRYVERQTTGTTSRAVKKREKTLADIKEKHERRIRAAEDEYRGMLWLFEHNVNLDNCIYYDHTQTFSFGWKGDGVSESVKSALLDILAEFPYKYEIKTNNKTL